MSDIPKIWTWMGVPFDEMSREELLAVAAEMTEMISRLQAAERLRRMFQYTKR